MKTYIAPSQLFDPALTTAIALANINGAESVSTEIVEQLREPIQQTIEQIKVGNLAPLEEILITQAILLNSIFCQFTAKGSSITNPSFTEALPNYSKNLINLALKAQNQCRSTIEAINEIKNPKTTTFVKNQLNHLQLELEQLSEEIQDNAPKLDSGTEAIAIGEDQELAAVAALHRSKNLAG